MIIKEYILMGLRDLWRRKGRTILTSLGITIGTLLIVTMVGLGSGLNELMNKMFNSEGISKSINVINLSYLTEEEQADFNPNTMYEDYFKVIDNKTIDEIKATGKIQSLKAYLSGGVEKIKINDKTYTGYTSIKGYDIKETFYADSEIESIRKEKDDSSLKPIKEGRYLENSGEMLINEEFIKSMGFNNSDILNKEIQIIIDNSNGIEIEPVIKSYKVVGIIDENFGTFDSFVFSAEDVSSILEISTMQKDYLKNQGYSNIDLITNKLDDVEDVSSKLKEMNYMYSSAQEQAKSINDTLGALSAGFAVLGLIVLIVAAIGIINTMSMAVIERTRGIGVMKSVGANRTAIKTMFLVQSSIIGLLGSGVGVILASGINLLIQFGINNYISQQNMNITITIGLPWYYILGILFLATLIALVSGISPASRASKLEPIEALRG